MRDYMQAGLRMSTSGGQHSFARIPSAEIERSVFNRSFGHKTTFNPGYLIPIFVDEVLPGDTMQMRATAFGRMTTLLRPIMDNLYMDLHFFFVPYRLVWANWKKFNGEQVNPGDSTSFTIPVTSSYTAVEQELSDYMGLPVGKAMTHSVLPFRAYNLIYNEWFRDENLVNSAYFVTTDGPDTVASNYVLRRRGKRHDYFTSCLPWAQKGTAVTVPLGTLAPVKTQATAGVTGVQSPMLFLRADTGGSPGSSVLIGHGAGAGGPATYGTNTLTGAVAGVYPSNLYADLSTATASTINQLRQSFQIQRLLERDARGGTRYTEILRAHFGVISPDARLQRPEFLGGGTVRINVNPIANTAEPAGGGALGDLGANGTFGSQHTGFRQSFTEHGVIIGLASVRADLNYQQGMEKMWFRSTRFDFYWPALAHLGEQSVLNKEIYYNNDANDALTFGYQERYAEYRYKPSLITGRLRSTAATPLDSWHVAQKFTTLPTLNQTFIEENPPVDRVVAIAAATEPNFVADFFFEYRCARPMPVFGVPGLIDHF